MIDIQPFAKATGKLEPARKASLHFQVSGQINERFVEAGTRIKAKDKMLSVDSGDFFDAVEESKALLEIKRDTILGDFVQDIDKVLHFYLISYVLYKNHYAKHEFLMKFLTLMN